MIVRKPFRRIGVAEAQTLLQRGNPRILDVRDAAAFRADHIAGAENVSVANLFAIIEWAPKTTPVLIYCYKGYASQEFAQIFSDFRFQEVYSLDGGFEAWSSKKSGRATVAATEHRHSAEPGHPVLAET